MSDKDIEDLLAKNENESPLMIIDDVPIEFEDVHINYRMNNQTRFETIVKSGVCIFDFFFVKIFS